MDTKGIDLKKCTNCRYRAKVDEVDDYGRICVETGGLAFLRSDNEDGYIATWHTDIPVIEGICGRKVTNFEIVPRDPETYKDWQVGDKVCEKDNKDSVYRVIFRSGELVVTTSAVDRALVYTCNELYNDGCRLVLTDIERQIIEEREKAEWKPQDGDICFVRTSSENCFIFIKKDSEVEEEIYSYASFDTNGHYLFLTKVTCVCHKKDIRELRPATDEGKQRLFDAMANEGKRWNAEKKVVEDIPKPYEFKKGEPVLVRIGYIDNWRIAVFSKKRDIEGDFEVVYGNGCGYYDDCIPYNEKTMHLLGTTEDYKEE